MMSCLRPTTLVLVGRRSQWLINSQSVYAKKKVGASCRNNLLPHQRPIIRRTTTATSSSNTHPRGIREIWNALRKTPLQYATIPAVAAFLGLSTNWVGVQMLFYPIEYTGTEWYVISTQGPILSSDHNYYIHVTFPFCLSHPMFFYNFYNCRYRSPFTPYGVRDVSFYLSSMLIMKQLF